MSDPARVSFAEQQQRTRAKQRYFSAVMRAARLTRRGASVAVEVHGVPVRTAPDAAAAPLAVVRVRRGYTLLERPAAAALAAGRVLFYCERA